MDRTHPEAHAIRRAGRSLARLARRLFPERQILIRTEGRGRYLRISRMHQVSVAVLVLALLGWTGFVTYSFVSHDRLLASKEEAVARVRLAYSNLLGEVVTYQKKFTSLAGDLEENQDIMLRLVEQNATLQQNLKTAKAQLLNTQVQRGDIVERSERLKAELANLEKRLAGASTDNQTLKQELSQAKAALDAALAERDRATAETQDLTRKVADLEGTLTDLQETEDEILEKLTSQTAARIEGLERTLARTGVDLEPLLAKRGDLGQGGPFVEALPDAAPAHRMRAALSTLDNHINRWVGLRELLQRLPLTAPLDYYYVSSYYGKRSDPVNNKLAMHHGLDLAATLNSPVYVTAPGVVTYAGRKGNYGYLVEVDHGGGVKTRYGHLNKMLVKKGQKVQNRDKIGLVGNTGRSTGSHTHYEILIDGETVNPLKFIKAGKHVFQG